MEIAVGYRGERCDAGRRFVQTLGGAAQRRSLTVEPVDDGVVNSAPAARRRRTFRRGPVVDSLRLQCRTLRRFCAKLNTIDAKESSQQRDAARNAAGGGGTILAHIACESSMLFVATRIIG